MALSSQVKPSEPLGRFLTQSKHFVRTNNEVKFKAFMPPRNLRLSVYRIYGLKLDEIWGAGQKVILAMPERKTLYGVADIKAGIVEREKLEIEPDKLPCRHANIVGWPENDARQLSITQKLAAEAKLILKH